MPSTMPPLLALFLCLLSALFLTYSASPLRKLIPLEAVPTMATVEFIAPLCEREKQRVCERGKQQEWVWV